MIKHTVELNYENCERDNVDPKSIWNTITRIYSDYNMYFDGKDSFIADFPDDNYTKEACARAIFSLQKWFFTYTKTWTAYDTDDDEFEDMHSFWASKRNWEKRKKSKMENSTKF